ncbi:hypothetical protein O181_053525 [Austropuccinia psidii MF-1]|uniref:Uncharacterized protein n=1 Tax=Austropuccinia psidii MF-1 TaxID=1389203 RepID=A0A9Q3E0S6_9BASI|nr:hypothetical protein [Austropuccinia psidii MF-1]
MHTLQAAPRQEGILLGFENENTADLKVTITRNTIFNENVFPDVHGEKSQMPWNVEEVFNKHPLDQSTDGLPLSPNETNLPSTINGNSLMNIIQKATD